MSKITLNELLPTTKKVKKIQTGSELLLAYELNKYARTMLGLELSLSDVTINKELLEGEHFSFVVMNGLDVGFVPDRSTLAEYSSEADRFFEGTVDGVVFKSRTPEEVVFDIEYKIESGPFLKRGQRARVYVSLIAFLIVESFKNGVQMPKLIIDHMKYNHEELEYVDLLILKNYGNCIVEGMLDIRYGNNWKLQPEWEAFVMQYRQRGYMDREYSSVEKFRHLRKNFEVGDVVLLYQRTKGAEGRTINRLTSCYPAVITHFDQDIIRCTYYPMVKTLLTHHMELDEVSRLCEDDGKESLYTYDDYSRFTTLNVTYPLTEIGVGTCTFIEKTFFIKPLDFDGSYQYLRTVDGRDNVWLSTLDTIYAVFEDRGVRYNKEKFLETYFHSKGRTPVYDLPRYAESRLSHV